MDRQVTVIIRHIAKSQEKVAQILEAKRSVVEHSAVLLGAAAVSPEGENADVAEQAVAVAKSITAYLNSLADLEMAVADNMSVVMKELTDTDEE
jgi:hypothetical protein